MVSSPRLPGRPAKIYRAEDYRPDDSAAWLMRRILNGIASEVDRALEPTGLTHAQWLPLFKLHMGLALTVAELARECHLDTGAMTRMLDRLEAKGLVRRVRSERDRRVVNLELTEAGQAAASQIPHVLSEVQNAHLQGFTRAEWEQLMGLLRRIYANSLALQAARQTEEE